MHYKITSQELEYNGDNKRMKKVLEILSSNPRDVIAHFNNHSFSLKGYKLPKNDEYNMASAAWSPEVVDKPIAIHKDFKGDKSKYFNYVMVGEDLMLGSYILTRLKAGDSINELKKLLLDLSNKADGLRKILLSGKKYFNFCIDYGKTKAKESKK